MSPRGRRTLFLLSGAALAGLLVWAVRGLPEFGRFAGAYGRLLDRDAVPERRATNVVSSVTFDYRGFDTMGEEFILFAAVMGAALLLRERRHHGSRGAAPLPPSDALRVLAASLSGFLVLVGLYVVAHGPLTPGGGFQGGVVLASALAVVFLAGGYGGVRRLTPPVLVDLAEAVALAGFVGLGIAGAAAGHGFLANLLPLGRPGTLASAGTITVLNVLTGLAVAAGFTLLFGEFLEEIESGG